MIRLLIVTPAFNEERIVPEFVREAAALRQRLAATADVRVLFVDDGSTDATVARLREAAEANPTWIAFVSLVSNAGHQAALIAGLCHMGDWPDVVVTMDADLEHPMEVVPKLLDEWQRVHAVVVHAIRLPARALPLLKRLASAMFYKVTSVLTGLDLASGQADFRLWDATVLRSVSGYLPHVGSLRVFAAWLPGLKASIPYEQRVREDRTSRFTLRKNFEMTVTGIFRFSHVPLTAITVFGAIGLIFAFVYGLFIAIESSHGHTIPGWSSTVLTVMAMGCLQLVCLGVLASYLRRLVFARDLPPWIVRTAQLGPLGGRERDPDRPA